MPDIRLHAIPLRFPNRIRLALGWGVHIGGLEPGQGRPTFPTGSALRCFSWRAEKMQKPETKKSTTPSESPLVARQRAAKALKALPPELRRAVILEEAQRRGMKVPEK